jgi:hypothetical protein
MFRLRDNQGINNLDTRLRQSPNLLHPLEALQLRLPAPEQVVDVVRVVVDRRHQSNMPKRLPNSLDFTVN